MFDMKSFAMLYQNEAYKLSFDSLRMYNLMGQRVQALWFFSS
jgi:hypothetical protein